MALPNGDLWPFCVVMAKSDPRLKRHAHQVDAEAEAKRLAQKEGTPMCVLRLIARFDPIVTPIQKRVPGHVPVFPPQTVRVPSPSWVERKWVERNI